MKKYETMPFTAIDYWRYMLLEVKGWWNYSSLPASRVVQQPGTSSALISEA